MANLLPNPQIKPQPNPIFYKFLFLIFFISGFINTPPNAQQNPCTDFKTIKSIKVPWDPTKIKSSTFEYRFKHEIVNPLAPTVIIIPGRPDALTSILTNSVQWPLGAIPAQFNKIYTDPRSQGCNYVAESQALVPYLKTEFVVNDIFLVIKSLNLKNYIIYGASYGTVVATQLTKKLETEKFELPTALVLEGTMGKKYDNFDSYFYFHQYEWDKIFAQLPLRWKTYFQTAKNELAFNKQFNKYQWGSLIASDLVLGDVPADLHLLELYFSKKITAKEQSSLPALFSKLREVQFPNLFFRMIACGELWGDWYYGRSLENGRLIRSGKNICEGVDYKNPYDASKYQVTVPIYYFQGSNDPVTPMPTALYHFAVQKKANRQFLMVSRASHAPLSNGLSSCADELWNAISSQRTLGRELSYCQRHTVLTAKQSGQD